LCSVEQYVVGVAIDCDLLAIIAPDATGLAVKAKHHTAVLTNPLLKDGGWKVIRRGRHPQPAIEDLLLAEALRAMHKEHSLNPAFVKQHG
jgi:hypothetical protein